MLETEKMTLSVVESRMVWTRRSRSLCGSYSLHQSAEAGISKQQTFHAVCKHPELQSIGVSLSRLIGSSLHPRVTDNFGHSLEALNPKSLRAV